MNEQQLRAWMAEIEQRLAQLEAPAAESSTAPQVREATTDAPPMTTAKLAGAFNRRYEQRRSMAWAYGPHVGHLQEISDWVNAQQGQPNKVAATLLDNWFRTDWALKVDYKPRFLAENLGGIYNPPVVKRKDEPDPEAINEKRLRERRQQEDAELRRKLDGHEETASKPPALEELVGKIGRKL